MAGTEATDALTVYFTLLKADTTLQAFIGQKWYKDVAQTAPGSSPPWPFGIGQVQAATDIQFLSARRVGADTLLMLKVIGLDGDFTATLRPAYRRVDALVQGTSGSSSDVLIIGKAVREQLLDYSEIVNGQVIRHLGGVYRVLAQ